MGKTKNAVTVMGMLYSGLNSANVTFCNEPTEHTQPSLKNPKYNTANTDIQNTPFLDLFFRTNQVTTVKAAAKTNTSNTANA